MGSPTESKKWHVYSACAERANRPLYTLEMCMTGLDKERAEVFYKSRAGSAVEMTKISGIREILPGSAICDFEFDPCGYSMNSIEGDAISTIHVTPEDGFSYASFEAMGYSDKEVDLGHLVERVLKCFRPAEFSVAIHSDGWVEESRWGGPLALKGYVCGERICQDLGRGGSVVYQSLKVGGGSECGSPRSILKCCWEEREDESVE
ncbi:S-adenosylmethionine decarboxylase proenzyme [Acorus calamus]|uniref:S-adenosylmethionine decarboxylase proenzyme n=1 Tax=Acorus calamus TaxID=4465 RepID=A0AAV9EDG3_ACOCL|nr:S-adenosylmethionine decarboxylase proenzyme [Acorus calamus]